MVRRLLRAALFAPQADGYMPGDSPPEAGSVRTPLERFDDVSHQEISLNRFVVMLLSSAAGGSSVSSKPSDSDLCVTSSAQNISTAFGMVPE